MSNKNETKILSIAAQEEEIRTFLETIVHRTVTQDDQVTFMSLLQIMGAQPQWEHKLDRIIAFRVTRRRKYKSLLLQLKVVRCNRWLTVSWKKGVMTKRKEPDPLKVAMRNAISRQSSAWGKANWVSRCCQECKGSELLQVDHVDPQFAQIRKEFIASFPEEYEFPNEFKPSKRGPRFLPGDVKFTRLWQKYHSDNARYQWLCRDCNCRKPKQ